MNEKEQAETVARDALLRIKPEVDELSNWAIESDDDNNFAAEMLRDVKARNALLETKRKTITTPLNEALKAVNELFRAPRQLLERAEALLKGKIAAYLAMCAERNNAALLAAGNAETAEQAMEALTAVLPAEAPKGVTVRYRWWAVVTDASLVPAEYCSPDQVKIDAAMRMSASKAKDGVPSPISGVGFRKEPIVTSRKVS